MVRGCSSHPLRYRSLRSFVHFLKYFNLKRRVSSTTLAPPRSLRYFALLVGSSYGLVVIYN